MTRRSRHLVLLAHCILNQNAVVQPLARMPAAFDAVVQTCLEAEAGLLQLPCPEMVARGPNRAQDERHGYDTPTYRALCRQLLTPIRDQVRAYEGAGYTVIGLIGIGDSPSCGLDTTHEGGPRPGRGVFMEELLALLPELEGRYLQVPRRYGEDAQVTAAFDEQVRAFCRQSRHGGEAQNLHAKSAR